MDIVVEIGLWISAFYVISVYSLLWKYNKFFKFAEHTLIGAAAGHFLVMGLLNIRNLGIGNILGGKILYLIPILLGLTLFARFTPKYSWVMRWGMAFLIGVSLTIYMRSLVITQITAQIQDTLKNVSFADPMKIVNTIVVVGFVFTTMLYFLFTERLTPKGPASYIGKIGRYGVMTAIGYYLGVTVMTRLAFVINRLEFLLFEWLRIPR
jgi:hypothetical protein